MNSKVIDGKRKARKIKLKVDRKHPGRPYGSGPWGESTKPMQIPISLIPILTDLMEDFIKANDLGDKAIDHLKTIKKRFHIKDIKGIRHEMQRM